MALFVQALVTGLLMGGVYAAYSSGFSLIFGVMNIVNIFHGELIMIGAFTTYWLFSLYHIDPFLTLPSSDPLGRGHGLRRPEVRDQPGGGGAAHDLVSLHLRRPPYPREPGAPSMERRFQDGDHRVFGRRVFPWGPLPYRSRASSRS